MCWRRRVSNLGSALAVSLVADGAVAQTATLALKPIENRMPVSGPLAWNPDRAGARFVPARGPRQPSARFALTDNIDFVASAGKDRALKDSAARRPDGAAARGGSVARLGLSVRW